MRVSACWTRFVTSSVAAELSSVWLRCAELAHNWHTHLRLLPAPAHVRMAVVGFEITEGSSPIRLDG